MIRMGAKPSELMIAPPDPLKLLVEDLYSRQPRQSPGTKDKEDYKLPDKDTFSGYKYSWMMNKGMLDMEKANYMNELANEAKTIQDQGGDPLAFLESKKDEIQKFNYDYMTKNIMLDSYWDKMVDDKKSAESIRQAIVDPTKDVEGSDYVYDEQGRRITVGEWFPDVTDDEKDLPLTIGHYLELVESSSLGFDKEGKLVTDYRAYELPDMQGLWQLFDETYNSPGGNTVSTTYIDRLREVDRLNGEKTIDTESRTVKDTQESHEGKIDAFISRATTQYSREWGIMRNDYMEANSDRWETYRRNYNPAIHKHILSGVATGDPVKDAEKYADFAIEADLRRRLQGMQDARQLKNLHEETIYNYFATDEYKEQAREESMRFTMYDILSNSDNVQWEYGQLNTGGYKTREAIISNLDKVSEELSTPLKNDYNNIFNIIQEGLDNQKVITYEQARTQYIDGLKEQDRLNAEAGKPSNLAGEFEKNEITARKELVEAAGFKTVYDTDKITGQPITRYVSVMDTKNPDAYTLLIAKENVKTKELVNERHYDLNVNPQLESEFYGKRMEGQDIYLVGGKRFRDSAFPLYLYAPTGETIRIVQGLPDDPKSEMTAPKAISYVVVDSETLKNMSGTVEGKDYYYWENRENLGVREIDRKMLQEDMKEKGILNRIVSDLGEKDSYYIVPIMYNATKVFSSFDFGKEK